MVPSIGFQTFNRAEPTFFGSDERVGGISPPSRKFPGSITTVGGGDRENFDKEGRMGEKGAKR